MGRSEIKAVEDADDGCNDADDDGSDAGNRQGGEEKRQEHEYIGLEGALDGGEPVELEQQPCVIAECKRNNERQVTEAASCTAGLIG